MVLLLCLVEVRRGGCCIFRSLVSGVLGFTIFDSEAPDTEVDMISDRQDI